MGVARTTVCVLVSEKPSICLSEGLDKIILRRANLRDGRQRLYPRDLPVVLTPGVVARPVMAKIMYPKKRVFSRTRDYDTRNHSGVRPISPGIATDICLRKGFRNAASETLNGWKSFNGIERHRCEATGYHNFECGNLGRAFGPNWRVFPFVALRLRQRHGREACRLNHAKVYQHLRSCRRDSGLAEQAHQVGSEREGRLRLAQPLFSRLRNGSDLVPRENQPNFGGTERDHNWTHPPQNNALTCPVEIGSDLIQTFAQQEACGDSLIRVEGNLKLGGFARNLQDMGERLAEHSHARF